MGTILVIWISVLRIHSSSKRTASLKMFWSTKNPDSRQDLLLWLPTIAIVTEIKSLKEKVLSHNNTKKSLNEQITFNTYLNIRFAPHIRPQLHNSSGKSVLHVSSHWKMKMLKRFVQAQTELQPLNAFSAKTLSALCL